MVIYNNNFRSSSKKLKTAPPSSSHSKKTNLRSAQPMVVILTDQEGSSVQQENSTISDIEEPDDKPDSKYVLLTKYFLFYLIDFLFDSFSAENSQLSSVVYMEDLGR